MKKLTKLVRHRTPVRSPLSRKILCLLTAGVVLFVLGTRAHAQMITAIGDNIYPASTPAPGDATDYYFVGANNNLPGDTTGYPNAYGAQPVNLTDFTFANPSQSVVNGTGTNFGSFNYSDSTVPGGSTTFRTGAQYFNPPPSGSSPLLTFQLTNAAETNFNVYILTDNTDLPNNSVTLTEMSGTGSGATATLIPVTGTGQNDYLEFSVRNASTSDVFGISATASSNIPNIGGVTFQDVVTAPEPSTYVLLAAGALTLLAFQCRRLRHCLP